MPIYPREAASPSVPMQNTPMAPVSPQGRQIYEFGKTAENTALQFEEVRKKREDFRDDTLVTQRLMDASEDMANMEMELQKPENKLRAKEYFDQELQKSKPKWMEGLSPRAQLKLEQKLLPRQLEFKIGAAKMETAAMADMRDGEFTRMSNIFADRFSREVVSFDADGNVDVAKDANGQPIIDQDGKNTREWQEMEDYLNEDARMGYRKVGDVERIKEAELGKASYFRANKLTQSDSIADLRQYTKLYQAEMQQPGSTYLKRLDSDKRDALNYRAHSRIVEITEKNEVNKKKIETQDSNRFINTMLRSYATDDPANRMKPDAIEKGLNDYAHIMPRETVDALLKLRDAKRVEGGVTDRSTYHKLKIDILSQQRPVTIHDIVGRIGESSGNISAKDAEELIKLNETSSSEAAVEKISYFKEGKEHLKVLTGGVTMVPGFAWAMTEEKAALYSDALFQYSQHARKVYASGDSAQLMALPKFAKDMVANLQREQNKKNPKQGGDSGTGNTPSSPKPERKGSKPNFTPPRG